MRIAIDVKDPGAADAVIAEVRRRELHQRTMLWSQHEPVVRTAAHEAPELEVSLLRDTHSPSELDALFADADAWRVHGISVHWSQVTPTVATRCQAESLSLYSWCRTPDMDSSKLALLDGLVTDWPAAGRDAVARLP